MHGLALSTLCPCIAGKNNKARFRKLERYACLPLCNEVNGWINIGSYFSPFRSSTCGCAWMSVQGGDEFCASPPHIVRTYEQDLYPITETVIFVSVASRISNNSTLPPQSQLHARFRGGGGFEGEPLFRHFICNASFFPGKDRTAYIAHKRRASREPFRWFRTSLKGKRKKTSTYRNGAILPARNKLGDPVLREVVPLQRGNAPSNTASVPQLPCFTQLRWAGGVSVPEGSVVGAVHDAFDVLLKRHSHDRRFVEGNTTLYSFPFVKWSTHDFWLRSKHLCSSTSAS